jgi:hypothetical protein
VDGHHPGGRHGGQRRPHRVERLAGARREARLEAPGGLLAQDPRGVARVVALDHAAGGVEVAPGQRQRR